jgi:hypothetical protein
MAALISVEDVMTRLGIAETLQDDVTPAISAAITGATVRLETEMDTDLAAGSGTAVFHLDKVSYSGIQPSGMFRCLMPQGFIQGTPTVQECDKLGGVIAEVETTSYRFDKLRGLLFVDDVLADRFITVGYRSGFAEPDDLTRLPWIKEALLAYVPLVMNAGRTDAQQSNGGPSTSSYRLNGELAQGLIARYNRKVGLVMRPLYYVWTPTED